MPVTGDSGGIALMYFDDRLATVLRNGTGGDRAMRTQFRQLLDLLGTLPEDAEGPLVDAAFARLGALSQELPAEQRGAMIREPALRLSSSRLVTILASHEAEVASATMISARLPDCVWQNLIPALPLPARGFLRHRQDLGQAADAVLARLGISDLVLPSPDVLELSDRFAVAAPSHAQTNKQPAVAPSTSASAEPAATDAPAAAVPHAAAQTPFADALALTRTGHPFRAAAFPSRTTHVSAPLPVSTPLAASGITHSVAAPGAISRPAPPLDIPAQSAAPAQHEENGIGTLVRRIEAFQKARNEQVAQARRNGDIPPPAAHNLHDHAAAQTPTNFDFSTDAGGRINWSEASFAPMTVGLALASESADAPAQLCPMARTALRHRQPLRDATVMITGAPAIAGPWNIDAHPQFDRETGRYLGHYGRMQRAPAVKQPMPPATDQTADRVRQILHELRTPVNAIQGFAEIIQQQLYGPAPHEYRALAATIASDAARILAGFDELDRLARLESGALELDEGSSDISSILTVLISQIRPALLPRSSEISLSGAGQPTVVPLDRNDAERLCWRLMATLAGEASAGEEIGVRLTHDNAHASLSMDLPANLAGAGDIFSASLQANQRTLSGGMFGSGFTLRLARAEARAVGGDLIREGDTIRLSLPLLTEINNLSTHPVSSSEPTGANPG